MTDITVKLITPKAPNFIRIALPGQKGEEGPVIKIGDLTARQLDAITEDWRRKLGDIATKQKTDPEPITRTALI